MVSDCYIGALKIRPTLDMTAKVKTCLSKSGRCDNLRNLFLTNDRLGAVSLERHRGAESGWIPTELSALWDQDAVIKRRGNAGSADGSSGKT